VTEPSSSPSVEARFAVADGLLVRHFEDEAVVFDPLSWDAHVLNPAALAVLELLIDLPRTEAEIAAFLADALQPDEQPQARSHANRLVAELQSLHLVRRR